MTLRHTTKGLVLAAHLQQRSSGRSIFNDFSSPSVNKTSQRDRKLEPAFQRNPWISRVLDVVESGVMVRIHGGLQHVCNKLSLKLGHFLVVMY